MLSENLADNPTAAALAEFATGGKFEFGELTVEIDPRRIIDALRRLKNDLKFERLTSVTGVDRYPAEPRFEVVYHLQSVSKKERIRIKARLSGENPEIESAVPVYRSADWYERETFDFFGVRFLNHPDLRRIMLPEDWEGYPLRKDYPVTGTRY
ncbi:MAG TPA: NADH-quinone oxidoreductase subunit C [Bryobacteraceae bacterium]|nr:NADH-quinone oxidoreductase subunit C [Bryobacteraceae bacterium]